MNYFYKFVRFVLLHRILAANIAFVCLAYTLLENKTEFTTLASIISFVLYSIMAYYELGCSAHVKELSKNSIIRPVLWVSGNYSLEIEVVRCLEANLNSLGVVRANYIGVRHYCGALFLIPYNCKDHFTSLFLQVYPEDVKAYPFEYVYTTLSGKLVPTGKYITF